MKNRKRTLPKKPLLDVILEEQSWEPIENFPDDGHREMVREHRDAWHQLHVNLDSDKHDIRCKLLARWLDDSWQHDYTMFHEDYMEGLAKAIKVIKRDDSYIFRDAVLWTYYPEFAWREFVNWYDEDAEYAICKQYGTKRQKQIQNLEDRLKKLKDEESKDKIKAMLKKARKNGKKL